jgi:hypothetical protein
MGLHDLRWKIIDGERSLGARQRARRWRWLTQTFPDLDQMTVIDLGGQLSTWHRAPVRAKHVHVVNLTKPPTELPSWAEVDRGDACALPEHIRSRRYDLVFSNSVLEHVGGHERRLRFADTVHALSGAHWVQTPYRYFPIEPHWLVPGLQFLPVALRASIAYRWPLAYTPGRGKAAVLSTVLWTDLVDRTQMRVYFPDSRLRAERVLGLTKSLIAVRGGLD